MRGFFAVNFVGVIFFMLMRGSGVGQGFAGKQFDDVRWRGRERRRRGRLIDVCVPMIVIFEIFENVADVKESIAIEADVNESGLHAG